MKLINFCQSFVRSFCLVLVVMACALGLMTQFSPAYAAQSDPTKGEDILKGIEAKSWEVIEADSPYDFNKTQTEANKGINEVQGDADKEKMKTPANSRNAAPSIEQTVKKNLETIKNKTQSLVD